VTTDEALMLAYQAGDRGAFEELFDRYRAPIWTFFKRRTWQPGEADELTQETFLAVLQAAARYRPQAAFRSYLFAIAFNQLLAWRRRARRDAPPVPEGQDVSNEAADPADLLWVREALAALAPDDREIVMLREYDALTYAEIATLVGLPATTIRSRLFRARASLRARLAGEPVAEGQRP
jgi:RNA polymerase sigma-70 factor (ECF subfamily)